MLFLYKIGAGEVGNRPGHPAHPIRSSPGEKPGFHTPVEELSGTPIEWLAVEINPEHVTVNDPALVLGVASSHDAATNIARGLAGWAQQRVRLR
jgi:hypothetical protein